MNVDMRRHLIETVTKDTDEVSKKVMKYEVSTIKKDRKIMVRTGGLILDIGSHGIQELKEKLK